MRKIDCKNCIWSEQCYCDDGCDFYEPAYEDEQDEINEEEYITDLKERQAEYKKHIKEQNS